MVDLLKVQYGATGKSSKLNALGMREMQARAFESRSNQYLLLKAPPASGKSRALMFLGLDKLKNQGIQKIIVAVPEMSIGASFRDTELTKDGFFSDWSVLPQNNLCLSDFDSGKVLAFMRFMHAPGEQIMICTHATLRFAFDRLKPSDFNNTLLGIDEFHHVSVDGDNRLGVLIDTLMKESTAHIVAMTGSYFRGDTIPILLPEDEAKFAKVTYTYYEQLNGYSFLKSLGIGYHFYQGSYIDALKDVLDSSKKTIIHIPNVNSGESTKDKYSEVDHIIDALGVVAGQDSKTGIITVQRPDGSHLKVANLVDDNPVLRPLVTEYLRTIRHADDMDVIIALGMAKEGFDWPWCEHVLTIGYRSSMTEIVQIIGRATRDCEGKPHAQFTNLIAQPDAEDDDVKVSVNNMLKAITLSLLMEQVLAPAVTFKPRSQIVIGEKLLPGTIIIEDATAPVSAKVVSILNGDSDELIAALIQKPAIAISLIGGVEPEVINNLELPKIIETRYPDLSAEEAERVRIGVLTKALITTSGGLFEECDLPADAQIEPKPADQPDEQSSETSGTTDTSRRQFIKLGQKFINIEHVSIDLIAEVNPFHGAYEILSKSVTAAMLKTIQDVAGAGRITITEEEVIMLWPRVVAFKKEFARDPSISSNDPTEVRYAEAHHFLKNRSRQILLAKSNARPD